MDGWLWYVVHILYIPLGIFKIDYRINILYKMDKISPVIEETWWNRFENPMALIFSVANDWDLNFEWIDDNNIR